MLNQPVGIQTPSSLGGGQYSLNLFFQQTTKAKYVALDDILKDSTNKQYKVVSFTAPFVNGASMTVEFITSDNLPTSDVAFNSLFYTPGQLNYRPEMRTSGNITAPTIYNASNYEYTLSGGWSSSVEANKVVLGDRIVDGQGYEFEISFLTVNKFTDPFRVKEVEKIGQQPTAGTATLYRPTSNLKFFQGTELTDPARTSIQNRDLAIIDLNIQSGGGIENLQLENNTGSTLSGGRVVRKDGVTSMTYASWTDENTTKVLGVLLSDTLDGNIGDVREFGTLPAGTFSTDDFIENAFPSENTRIYLGSTDGKMTVTPPEPGENFTFYLGLWQNNTLSLQLINYGT